MNLKIRGSALALFLGVAVAAMLAAFCLDAAVFRSGLYKLVVSPDSSAGSTQQMIRIERARALPNPRRVLVLGNSQQAEGFSARIARQVLAGERIDIVNAGVPGLSTRAWFYLVRDLDPDAKRYNVIAIPFADYADLDFDDLQAGHVQDLNFLVGSLRLPDVWEFAESFPEKDRWGIVRGAIFEGLTYREDVRDFLRAPRQRWAATSADREHGAGWLDDYKGMDKSLEGMTYDPASGTLNFAPGTPAETERFVRDRLNRRKMAVGGSQRAYLRRWLGKIAERYRGKDVRFVLFRMPQYPVHVKSPEPDANSVVNEWKRDPRTIVIPENEFDWLEEPKYAADGVHLNATGRVLFSEALGRKLSASAGRFPAED